MSVSIRQIEERRDRFIKCVIDSVDDIIDSVDDISEDVGFALVEVFEKIEGRSLACVVSEKICEERGIGVVKMDPMQKFNFDIDTQIEKCSGRKVMCHAKSISDIAVGKWLPIFGSLSALNRKELISFVRKFYRRGDYGLMQAEIRSLRFSIGGAVCR